MTLNGAMAVILRYFSEFGYLPGVLRKSARSLPHLLMIVSEITVFVLKRDVKLQLTHSSPDEFLYYRSSHIFPFSLRKVCNGLSRVIKN